MTSTSEMIEVWAIHSKSENRRKIVQKKIAETENRAALCYAKSEKFYGSNEWQKFRIEMLKKFGSRCFACGATAREKQLHVDHIRPRSIHPERSFERDNIQILCAECNLGKLDHEGLDFSTVMKQPEKLQNVSEEINGLREVGLKLKFLLENLPVNDKDRLTSFGFLPQHRKKLHTMLFLLIGSTHKISNIKSACSKE